MKHDLFIQFPVFSVLSGTSLYKSCIVIQENFDYCTACCFWRLWVPGICSLWMTSHASHSQWLLWILMEAVPYLPIKVLRFCSNLDYGCSAWNVWVRLVSSGSAYFYFECLSFPWHLPWNRRSPVFSFGALTAWPVSWAMLFLEFLRFQNAGSLLIP